jgi:hypothetical protein
MQLYFGLFALVTAIWVAIDARPFDWMGNRIGNKTWQWIVGAFCVPPLPLSAPPRSAENLSGVAPASVASQALHPPLPRADHEARRPQ